MGNPSRSNLHILVVVFLILEIAEDDGVFITGKKGISLINLAFLFGSENHTTKNK